MRILTLYPRIGCIKTIFSCFSAKLSLKLVGNHIFYLDTYNLVFFPLDASLNSEEKSDTYAYSYYRWQYFARKKDKKCFIVCNFLKKYYIRQYL